MTNRNGVQFIWGHDCDVGNMTEIDRRKIIMRHADLTKFCAENLNFAYTIHSKFDERGIRVDIANEHEFQILQDFIEAHWIHLHD